MGATRRRDRKDAADNVGIDGRAESHHNLTVQRHRGGIVGRRDGGNRRRYQIGAIAGGEVGIDAVQVLAIHVVVTPRHVEVVVGFGQQLVGRGEGCAQAVRCDRHCAVDVLAAVAVVHQHRSCVDVERVDRLGEGHHGRYVRADVGLVVRDVASRVVLRGIRARAGGEGERPGSQRVACRIGKRRAIAHRVDCVRCQRRSRREVQDVARSPRAARRIAVPANGPGNIAAGRAHGQARRGLLIHRCAEFKLNGHIRADVGSVGGRIGFDHRRHRRVGAELRVQILIEPGEGIACGSGVLDAARQLDVVLRVNSQQAAGRDGEHSARGIHAEGGRYWRPAAGVAGQIKNDRAAGAAVGERGPVHRLAEDRDEVAVDGHDAANIDSGAE